MLRFYTPDLWILRFAIILTALTLSGMAAEAQVSGKIDGDTAKVAAPAKGSLDKPIDYKATDSIIFDIRKNKVFLYRGAGLHYGDIDLKAHYIEVDLTRKEIFARGGRDSAGKYSWRPELKDGNEIYVADSMRYNSGSKKGRVYGLKLKQDEAVVHLGTVLKQADGSFVGENGKISTCENDHPHFYLNASKVKVVPNEKVYFGAANLVVEDVPTPLAIPFGLAPLKKGKRNGILFPAYGYNQANQSFYLQNLGYFQGLGPNASLTLSSDAYLNGDFRAGISTQFVKRYKFRGNVSLNASWFGNGQERTSPAFKRNLDMGINGGFAFDQKYLPGITLNGDVRLQTGNFNRRNTHDITSISNNQFQSGINFGKNFFRNKLNLTASARHSQNTSTHIMRIELPSVNVGVSSLTPFARKNNPGNKWYEQLRISYSMGFTNVLNTTDTMFFSKEARNELKKMQTGVTHSIPISTNLKLLKGILNLSPGITYTERWYVKGQTQRWDTGTKKYVYTDTNGFWRVNNYNFNANLSTNIYGTIGGLHSGKLRALRHTITPTMSVGYTPKISALGRGWHKTFLDSSTKKPIKEYDLFEKSYQGTSDQKESGYLNFSLLNNLQAKRVVSKDSNGVEKLEKVNLIDQFSLNGGYNFLASQFKFSDIVGNFNTVLFKKINITSRGNFSLYQKDSQLLGKEMYLAKAGMPPIRLRNFNVSVATQLTPDMFRGKKAETDLHRDEADEAELQDIKNRPGAYYNFNLPWSLGLNYIFQYNAEKAVGGSNIGTNQIDISGDIRITPEWKVGYRTGFNFIQKELTSSEFNVARNLHCWQLEFRWIPSGFAKQWTFVLMPKSGLLQDLKLNKRVFFNPVMF
ncbi:MAG: hypothetical protein JNL57_05810 [Bacteroidetes bacterium]|nr:hypothetical protein [Bacteroidota bacterium]